jgi:DNA primase
MARIPDSFIDDLLNRVDLVDVVGKRVPLKRAGREFQARCPFHDERSASFTVSPQKQFYHCFGCGAHGSAVGFLMNYENMDFADAVESLAADIGLIVPYEGGGYKRVDGSDALFPVLSDATQFFRRELESAPEAQAYLERRGVDRAASERFQLGWAPANGNKLMAALGTSPERKKALEMAGLTGSGGTGDYSKFRERVMFPILDKRGRTIAFGGRIIGAGEPKYLNSPETALFKKSQELYGLYFARQFKHSKLVVVEGYMDVLSLAQFGVTEAVATLGTATSREHAEMLFRNAEDVVFCFDGDRAGRAAAWRALTNVLPRMREGRQAHFLFLPDGEDPDSIVRKEGSEGFRARYDSALPLSKYLFDELGKQADISSIDGRARLAEKARPLLAQIPEGAFAELMQAELSRLTGVSQQSAPAADSRDRFERAKPQTFQRRDFGDGSAATDLGRRTLVRQAIGLLLGAPEVALLAQPPYPFTALDAPGVALLAALIELARERPDTNASNLVEMFDGQPEHPALLRLLAAQIPGETEHQKQDFLAAIDKLNERAKAGRVQLLKERLVAGEISDAEKLELAEQLAGNKLAAKW